MADAENEAPAPVPATPSPLAVRLEIWFADHFHGHPAMRDTEAFNHVRHAVDDLKQRLEQEPPQ